MSQSPVPAINFHFSRVCNYKCKFCFHTKKNSYLLPLFDQIEILRQFREAGSQKVNFAGGEPFLYSDRLGELVRASKNLGYKSVSIITNGSIVKQEWFEKYGKYLDILGVSCDSINPEVNFKHGRNYNRFKLPVEQQKKIELLSSICHHQQIPFKVNTVVTQLNKDEILADFINKLDPCRWKIFQVLEIKNENGGEKVKDFLITPKEFERYVQRNLEGLQPQKKKILVKESNEVMQNSYVIVDEFGRLLDVSTGNKLPTHSVLKVGIKKALNELGNGFNHTMFYKRGGYYQWQKPKRLNDFTYSK
ncbi:radical SAM enzyme [Neocallimastix lanati (nom. inval.)]|uniref:Radical SAM enzyme n=1 Tax=Neocallimastix californiae TaxID=1754190 RepID=A0A1Y2EUH2_9FUNG|nr:radical SAM enzyme [Neocallimastix sp. JGI-2020a]ORY75208.1 radical SAM enzyme [Neocallimastix californiae]|eukprot:ORY75208.1 radical SAM enzyme [Neocallimastix californiae]